MITQSWFIGCFAGAGLVVLYLVNRSVFSVEQGYTAILTTFGKAEFSDEKRKILKTYGPGLRFKLPWQEKHTISIMDQVLDLSGEKGGISALTADGTILRLDSKLRFTLRQDGVYNYLLGLKHPMEHIRGVFTCLLRNEIANFSSKSVQADHKEPEDGSYALIRRERRRLNQTIEEFCQKEIDGHYGVTFNAVDLTDILPPDEIAQALNAVANAQADAGAKFARAQADSAQRVLSAERGVEIAKARSHAAEVEILTLVKYLRELKTSGTLAHYIARRSNEVYSDARATYIKTAT